MLLIYPFQEVGLLILFKVSKKKKNQSREDTPKLILQGQHYPDSKARRGSTTRKVNIPDENTCKNPQQNISKLNSRTH
jgi:hypothetical protein